MAAHPADDAIGVQGDEAGFEIGHERIPATRLQTHEIAGGLEHGDVGLEDVAIDAVPVHPGTLHVIDDADDLGR